MKLNQVFTGILVLFVLFSCNETAEPLQNEEVEVELDFPDPMLLKNKTYTCRLRDYAEGTGYLGTRESGKTLMLFDEEGSLFKKIKLKDEGPDGVSSVINVVFDKSQQEIVVLHEQGIMTLALSGEIKNHCKFESMVIIISGFDPARILVNRENYIVSAFHLKDLDLEVGSKEFVEKVSPIKIYDKKNCECTDSIPYPRDSKFQKGIFQTTFYEPFIAIDEKNNELKVVYDKLEDKIFRYDLSNKMSKLPTHDMNIDDAIFCQPLEWSEKDKLQANFVRDHDGTWFANIYCFEGYTMLAYKRGNITNDKNLYHKIFDNSGRVRGKFHINEFDKIRYILSHQEDNVFFALHNQDSLLVEPEGTSLARVELQF